MKSKRVLVTGGAGFIGSNLVVKLAELGADVTVLDSMTFGLGGNLYNLKTVRDRVNFVHGDQKDPELLKKLVPGKEIIFNLAGNVSHQDSMRLPFLDMDLNVAAQLQMMEVCKQVNTDAVVVYASTRQLYGNPKYLPVDEEHPVTPIDVNGVNKFAGEQYHTFYHRAHGLKTVVLRLTNTYGPRQLIRHARQGFIGWFMNRIVTNSPIQLYGTGQQLRDFNDVDDVVEAMLTAATTQACIGGVFNLSGEKASLETIARTLIKVAGRGQFERVEFPAEAKKIEIGDFYGTSEKLRKTAGWAPKITLEQGLKRMFEYYEAHKEHYLDP